MSRLLRAFAVATLAAGLVGVLRQRAEANAVKQGRLPAATAAAAVPVVTHTGAVGERLAGWVPKRPRTAAGRQAARLWAGPLTVIGFLVALSGGRRPRWDETHGCFVAEGVGGVSALALKLVGADANTIGQVVLSHRAPIPPALLAHEAVHVRQGERLGPLLFPAYVWLAARYGYRDHPLERAARKGARAVISS